MSLRVRAWANKWESTFVLGITIGTLLAGSAWWVYRVTAHIAWGETRNAEINAVDAKQSADIQMVRDASWSLLWWARAVSKQNGWPAPPEVPGMAERPASVVIPPLKHPSLVPGWMDLYAAEPDPNAAPPRLARPNP